jgi:hypothetical protein
LKIGSDLQTRPTNKVPSFLEISNLLLSSNREGLAWRVLSLPFSNKFQIGGGKDFGS